MTFAALRSEEDDWVKSILFCTCAGYWDDEWVMGRKLKRCKLQDFDVSVPGCSQDDGRTTESESDKISAQSSDQPLQPLLKAHVAQHGVAVDLKITGSLELQQE
jgi:hypothetical protein